MERHTWKLVAFGLALALVTLLTVAGLAQARGGQISGTVASPDGYPLPSGTVVKLFAPGEWEAFGQANVDNRYTLTFGSATSW